MGHTWEEAIEAVRRHTDTHSIDGAKLEIVAEGVRNDDDWWYVPVRAAEKPGKRYQYYEILSDIEAEPTVKSIRRCS